VSSVTEAALRPRAGARLRVSASLLRSRLWLLTGVGALYAVLLVYPIYLVGRDSVSGGLDEWKAMLAKDVVERVAVNTLVICFCTTVVTVVLAYICAAAIWRSGALMRAVLLGFVLLPFWTSVLVKNFAWAALLQDNGVINDAVQALGLADGNITLLHTRFAVIVGMVHYLLPYAVFPILIAMMAIDERVVRAAESLGASRWQIVRRIILPLTRPGIYSAALLTAIISVGFFITPAILGSPRDMMVANLINFYAHDLVDFQGGAVLAMLVTAAVSVLVLVYVRLPKQGQFSDL
jgi:ABC-type spermidine/putrescine transport system permease subunit I